MERLKKVWIQCKEQGIWFLLLLLTDSMAGLLLWLSGRENVVILSGLFFFFSAGVFATAVWHTGKREIIREEKVREFYENPDLFHEEAACRVLPLREQRELHEAGEILRQKQEQLEVQKLEREAYEEYIESWAHEVKTPLSLAALVLDNRREELEPGVYRKLEYARSQIQDSVARILAYARLKAEHKDYYLEKVPLNECCREVLEEFCLLLEEQGFTVQAEVPDFEITADRRSLTFILGQAVGNAVKYKKQDGTNPVLSVWAEKDEERKCVTLHIRDNGTGVKPSDMPFIFDRGFTGDTGKERKKSTGMGLYLAEQIAQELHIKIETESEYGHGFEICFRFVCA